MASQMIGMFHPSKAEQPQAANVANTTDLLALRNPKNYRFLPPQYTTQIREAGRLTAKSENLGNVITGAKVN